MPSIPGTINFPTALDDSTSLFDAGNNATTTLTDNPLTSGATTINVVSTALFGAAGALTIGSEIIFYTGKTATSFTGCVRAREGTVAAATHPLDTPVDQLYTARQHTVLADAIVAVQSKVGADGSADPSSLDYKVAHRVQLVDLGVVNAVDLLNGAQTVVQPVAGQFFQLYGAADYIPLTSGAGFLAVGVDQASYEVKLGSSVGTMIINSPVVFELALRVGVTDSGASNTAPITAKLYTQSQSVPVNRAPAAWLALHAYATDFLVLEAGHVWSANWGGAAGTSGAIAPDFASNIGGAVMDNDINWADEGILPTQGALHLYALVGT